MKNRKYFVSFLCMLTVLLSVILCVFGSAAAENADLEAAGSAVTYQGISARITGESGIRSMFSFNKSTADALAQKGYRVDIGTIMGIARVGDTVYRSLSGENALTVEAAGDNGFIATGENAAAVVVYSSDESASYATKKYTAVMGDTYSFAYTTTFGDSYENASYYQIDICYRAFIALTKDGMTEIVYIDASGVVFGDAVSLYDVCAHFVETNDPQYGSLPKFRNVYLACGYTIAVDTVTVTGNAVINEDHTVTLQKGMGNTVTVTTPAVTTTGFYTFRVRIAPAGGYAMLALQNYTAGATKDATKPITNFIRTATAAEEEVAVGMYLYEGVNTLKMYVTGGSASATTGATISMPEMTLEKYTAAEGGISENYLTKNASGFYVGNTGGTFTGRLSVDGAALYRFSSIVGLERGSKLTLTLKKGDTVVAEDSYTATAATKNSDPNSALVVTDIFTPVYLTKGEYTYTVTASAPATTYMYYLYAEGKIPVAGGSDDNAYTFDMSESHTYDATTALAYTDGKGYLWGTSNPIRFTVRPSVSGFYAITMNGMKEGGTNRTGVTARNLSAVEYGWNQHKTFGRSDNKDLATGDYTLAYQYLIAGKDNILEIQISTQPFYVNTLSLTLVQAESTDAETIRIMSDRASESSLTDSRGTKAFADYKAMTFFGSDYAAYSLSVSEAGIYQVVMLGQVYQNYGIELTVTDSDAQETGSIRYVSSSAQWLNNYDSAVPVTLGTMQFDSAADYTLTVKRYQGGHTGFHMITFIKVADIPTPRTSFTFDLADYGLAWNDIYGAYTMPTDTAGLQLPMLAQKSGIYRITYTGCDNGQTKSILYSKNMTLTDGIGKTAPLGRSDGNNASAVIQERVLGYQYLAAGENTVSFYTGGGAYYANRIRVELVEEDPAEGTACIRKYGYDFTKTDGTALGTVTNTESTALYKDTNSLVIRGDKNGSASLTVDFTESGLYEIRIFGQLYSGYSFTMNVTDGTTEDLTYVSSSAQWLNHLASAVPITAGTLDIPAGTHTFTFKPGSHMGVHMITFVKVGDYTDPADSMTITDYTADTENGIFSANVALKGRNTNYVTLALYDATGNILAADFSHVAAVTGSAALSCTLAGTDKAKFSYMKAFVTDTESSTVPKAGMTAFTYKKTGDLRLLFISDLHYNVMEGASGKENNPYGYSADMRAQHFINAVLAENERQNIDALFLLGDLTSSEDWYKRFKPGHANYSSDAMYDLNHDGTVDMTDYYGSQYDGIYQLKSKYLSQLENAGIPVYCVPGNHDTYDNSDWNNLFGYKAALDPDGSYGFTDTEYVVRFAEQKTAVVMLNSFNTDRGALTGSRTAGQNVSYWAGNQQTLSYTVSDPALIRRFLDDLKAEGYENIYIATHYLDGADTTVRAVTAEYDFITGIIYGDVHNDVTGNINGVPAYVDGHYSQSMMSGTATGGTRYELNQKRLPFSFIILEQKGSVACVDYLKTEAFYFGMDNYTFMEKYFTLTEATVDSHMLALTRGDTNGKSGALGYYNYAIRDDLSAADRAIAEAVKAQIETYGMSVYMISTHWNYCYLGQSNRSLLEDSFYQAREIYKSYRHFRTQFAD